MPDIDQIKRRLVDERRVHLAHARATLREIEDFAREAGRRVEEGRLDGLELSVIEGALRRLQRTVIQDEHDAFMQRELSK